MSELTSNSLSAINRTLVNEIEVDWIKRRIVLMDQAVACLDHGLLDAARMVLDKLDEESFCQTWSVIADPGSIEAMFQVESGRLGRELAKALLEKPIPFDEVLKKRQRRKRLFQDDPIFKRSPWLDLIEREHSDNL